jgi:hypothetical protein
MCVCVCVCVCKCLCVFVWYRDKGWAMNAPENKGKGCVHTCTIPAKAPTTTGAILPAAVSTEKNPCAVPVRQARIKRK